jgi:uncharacterized protein YkwD
MSSRGGGARRTGIGFSRWLLAGVVLAMGLPGRSDAASPSRGKQEEKVLAEINLARKDPVAYAKHVKRYRHAYAGNNIFVAPGLGRVVSKEGLKALDEAWDYLQAAKPAPPLAASAVLALAARDHAGDIGPRGIVGHVGSDGSTFADRIARHGRVPQPQGENIAFGWSDARMIVVQLIIDDGVPDRGHRHNLFNPDFKTVGIGEGPHSQYGTMCVMDFGGGPDAQEGPK